MRFVLRSAIMGVAVWVATLLPLHVSVEGGEGEDWWRRALVFVVIGALIVALNAVVKPVLQVLSLPALIFTLGLFSLVISWFMLWLAAWITARDFFSFATLEIGGFWRTLGAAIVIAIAFAILENVVPGTKKKDKRS